MSGRSAKRDDGAPRWEALIGRQPPLEGRYTRVVQRLRVHGGYLTGRQLLEQLVDERTRYLVLDLDRTFHRGVNLGELLGWELRAFTAYGEAYLKEAEAWRSGRFLLAWDRPQELLRYLLRGARLWAYPGLFYLFAIKVGMAQRTTRRWVYRLLGPQPVETAQELVRVALMHHLAELPLDVLRELARLVWRRYADQQVFFAEDFAALKRRYPRLTVVISSASPQPVLEVAREQLGVDEVLFSAIEEREGFLSPPHLQSRLFLLGRPPERIAPPATLRHNAGEAKVANLLARFPDFLDADVDTVGITDTTRGEDRAWTGVFKRLADVNSPAPFSPLVTARSPLLEIHSAQLLTAAELRGRAEGVSAFVDPRRPPAASVDRDFAAGELEALLAAPIAELERLADAYHRASDALHQPRARIERLLDDAERRIALAVEDYNRWQGPKRRVASLRLRRQLGARGELRRRCRQLERGLSQLSRRIDRIQQRARFTLDLPGDGQDGDA